MKNMNKATFAGKVTYIDEWSMDSDILNSFDDCSKIVIVQNSMKEMTFDFMNFIKSAGKTRIYIQCYSLSFDEKSFRKFFMQLISRLKPYHVI